MALVRSQIHVTVRQADPGRDAVVNTVYHSIGVLGGPSPDYQNHANEIRDLFAGKNTTSGSSFHIYANRALTVKVYDMADAKPRVPRATALSTPTTWETQQLAPREIAICLSFYGNNPGVKSGRGRIYIGPLNAADVATERIGPAMQAIITDLGHGLFDIGGQDVKHVVFSPTHNTQTTVQNYWCNDLWDVMRSREPKEATRARLAP